VIRRIPQALFLSCLLSAACSGDERTSDSRVLEVPDSLAAAAVVSDAYFDSLFSQAQTVYFAGRYDSAAVLLVAVHRQAKKVSALAAEARALTWLGLAAWRRGAYAEARRFGEEALDFKLRHQLTGQLFRSYNALGLLAWNENRLSEARRLFERAIDVADQTSDKRGAATAIGNLALVQTELGEFAAARAGFLTMQATMQELGEVRLQGNALTNLGMLEIRLDDPQAAIPRLEEALLLYASINYPTGTQSALGQLGTAYTVLGEPHLAFSALDSALRVARAQGLRQEEAAIIEALAEQYRDAGNFEGTLALYAEARKINTDLGLDIETGMDLRGAADIHVRLGELWRAREYAAQALAIHRRAGAELEELMDLLLLAEILDQSGHSDSVGSHIRAARRLAAELDARVARTEVALTEARIADRRGESGAVLEVLERLGADLARGDYSSQWEAHLLRTRAYARLGEFDSAAVAGRRALATVERVRRKFGSGVLRTAYVADKRDVYGEAVDVLLRLGNVDEAFEVADAARGRALLEQLAAARSPHATTVISLAEGETLLREVDRLVESIDVLEATPPDQRSEEQLAEAAHLYRLLDEARSDYETLLLEAAETHPGAVALLGGAHVDAQEVRDALEPGQLLVEYLVTPQDRVLIFVVSHSAIQVLESAVSAQNLTSRVRLARDLIARPGAPPSKSHSVLAGLDDVLFAPVALSGILNGVTEVIFVPHQVLNYVPFAALRNGTTGRYLIEDFTIRFLPSAAALPALASGSRQFGFAVSGATVLAPFPDELPATREEAEAVWSGMRRVRRHFASQATERALRRALEGTSLVHVASHGVMNARNPMFSRLELARGRSREPTDDGRLEVHELLGISVSSPIVFLSGCETGVGAAHSTAFARGEDYATLAQAFLYAGARNVIATLWPVEDAGAAAFAERFYRALATNMPADALAAAQRALLAHPRFSSPYHWAAYQLAGSGS
jgi:CHAT domain-containing protein